MEEKLPQRKPTHLGYFDYATAGAYFITICTEGRREILSSITQLTPTGDGKALSCTVGEGSPLPSSTVSIGVQMLDYIVGEGSPLPQNDGSPLPQYSNSTFVQLSKFGEIIKKWIDEIPNKYPRISVDAYVIMPNHIHMLLNFASNNGRGDPSPTLDSVMGWFKYQSTKDINKTCGTEGRKIFQRSFYDHVIRDRRDYDEHIKYIYENPMRWHYDELYKNSGES